METETSRRYRNYIVGNYGTPAPTFVRGEGTYVWDDAGKRYLDFGSGIAVSALGHAHPHWVTRVQEQVAKLAHVSNLYRNEPQALLAEKLSDHAPGGKWFFCNSGTEANEALIKLARLYGVRTSGEEGKRYKVVTAENAFHGRTFGGMSATPQQKIQKGFAPLLPGFPTARLNDIDSFAQAIDAQTAAVMIEPIQGESGIHCASVSFLNELRALCTEREVLLMLDEVQCGTGRTGTFFAHEAAGIRPDAIGMAKGLGGGFPIGGIWMADAFADLLAPGTHGSTFGGGPVACTAALAVLEVIESHNLLHHVHVTGEKLLSHLQALAKQFPDIIETVRGRGFMLGIVVKSDAPGWVAKLREAGLIAVPAGTQVIRLLPPLTTSEKECTQAVEILESLFRQA